MSDYEPKSKFYSIFSYPKFWFYASDPGVKHNNKQCKTCIYRSSNHIQDESGVYCDYIAFTGHMRKCHPSPTCERYARGRRLRPKQSFNPKHKAGFSNTIDEPPFARLKNFSK